MILNRSIIKRYLPYLAAFFAAVIFFSWPGSYITFYQEKQSLFVLSGDFLAENLTQPGAFLVYLGKFLTSFFYYPLPGALIMSAIICLIIFFISRIISLLSGRDSIFIPVVLGAGLFFLQTSYQFLFYNTLGLMLQLVMFWLTIRYLKSWIGVILFPFWYWLTGGFAWIFAIMFTIWLVREPSRIKIISCIVLWISILFIIWILKEFILFQPVKVLILYPFSKEDTGSQLQKFIPFISLIVLLPVISKLNFRLLSKIITGEVFRGISVSLVTLILFSSIIILRFDRKLKNYFYAEKLFFERKFESLIEFNTKHPTTNRLTIFLNNVALCETGKLNDRLFDSPQSPDGQSLFLKWEMFGEVLIRGGYFYYTTGMINESLRWAYENMIMEGLSPEGLKMLIRTEIINGNYAVASKYISVLDNTLFYRKEAERFRAILFNDRKVESDPELGIKRKQKISHDFFSITEDPYVNIERVLSVDSLDRNAFEYKMAYLMLTEDYQGLANGLSKLESLGFSRIPVNLEEAALVCRMSNQFSMKDLGNLHINPQTEARFRDFLQTFQNYGNDLKKAQPFLSRKFGNTFWYWAFYH